MKRQYPVFINELSMKGCKGYFPGCHVSGHACQEEIKLIYSLVKPKYAIPVHGEYRHLIAQARVAEDLGIPKGEYLYHDSPVMYWNYDDEKQK